MKKILGTVINWLSQIHFRRIWEPLSVLTQLFRVGANDCDGKFNQITFIPLGSNRVGFEIYGFNGVHKREVSSFSEE